MNTNPVFPGDCRKPARPNNTPLPYMVPAVWLGVRVSRCAWGTVELLPIETNYRPMVQAPWIGPVPTGERLDMDTFMGSLLADDTVKLLSEYGGQHLYDDAIEYVADLGLNVEEY